MNQKQLSLEIKFAKSSNLWLPVRNQQKLQKPLFLSYLTYSEIFPSEKNTEKIIVNRLSQFKQDELIRFFSLINYVLGDIYNEKNETFKFLKIIFPVDLERIVEKELKTGKKLFTRQQMMSLMKTLMVDSNPSGRNLVLHKNYQKLGEIFLRSNDFLEIDYTNKDKLLDKNQERELLRATVMRNLSFNASQQFRYLLPRTYALFFDCLVRVKNKYPNEFVDLVDLYKKTQGIDIKVFLYISAAIHGHYFGEDKRKLIIKNPNEFALDPNFFRKIKESAKEHVSDVFSLIAADKKYFKEKLSSNSKQIMNNKHYAFNAFWKKPFYKVSKDVYFPIDLSWFHEKITNGMLWDIHDPIAEQVNRAAENKKQFESKRNSVLACYGRAIEFYVSDLFERIFKYRSSSKLIKRVWSEIDDDKTSGVDFIIYCPPDTLIFLEVTSSTVRNNTLLNAEPMLIDKELKQLFFGSEDRNSKGRIIKLDHAINEFINDRLPLSSIKKDNITNIIPVLVMNQQIPQHEYIWPLYKELIEENNLLKERLDNLQFLDLEDLEILESVVSKGTDLRSIILGKLKNNGFKHDSMKNFLIFNNKIKGANTFLLNRMKDIYQEAVEFLF